MPKALPTKAQPDKQFGIRTPRNGRGSNVDADGFTTVQRDQGISLKGPTTMSGSGGYSQLAESHQSSFSVRSGRSVTNMLYENGIATGLRHTHYQLGEIVLAPFIVPNLKEGASGKEIIASSLLGPVCGKWRPYIIVGKTETYFRALACFTHGGKGPVSTAQQNEALHLKCRRKAKATQPFLQSVPDDRILEVTYRPHAGAVVYPGQVTTILYDYPIGKKGLGYLLPESKERLFEEVDLRAHLARVEVNEQVQKLAEWRRDGYQTGLHLPEQMDMSA